MPLPDEKSLARTLDELNDAFLEGRSLPAGVRRDTARFLASRSGMQGSYAGLPAPTAEDFTPPLRLFTGRKIATRAGTAHILGEEALRALLLLGVETKAVRDAVDRGRAGMEERFSAREAEVGHDLGLFCCGPCSVAYWRALAAGAYGKAEARLRRGLAELRAARDDKGGWGRFPFYGTLHALTELRFPEAREELAHAARACERRLSRQRGSDPLAVRRRILLERALSSR